ncbi:MAG: hypothetical protein ACR2QG_06385 [Gammaproteobacteria bacterium]
MKAHVLLILACLLTTACSTNISGQWEGDPPTAAPYKNILIVALVSSDNGRYTVERSLTDQLRSSRTAASASVTLAPKLDQAPRTQPEIINMLQSSDADALLVLKVRDAATSLGKTQREKYFESHIKETSSDKDKDSWASVGSGETRDELPEIKITAEVTTTLYDVAENLRAVYSINTTTRYKDKGGEYISVIAGEIATAVSSELRTQELIK